MEKIEFEELVALVPSELSNTLTKKQTLLLGYFIMLNGLDESKTNGTFYRSNDDILEDLAGEITKPTLISAIRTLETKNLIERTSGYRNKDGKQASIYKLNENNIFKNEKNMNNNELTLELVKVIKAMQEQINFQNKIIGKILFNQDLTHNFTLETPLNTNDSTDMGKVQLNENLTLNLTSDTESDIDKDINNNLNKIINNIKETSNNINNKLNKIEERENIINNIQEKEDDNELDSTEFENEVEDNEEINDSIPSEDEVKETMLAEEQIEIPSEQGYIDINLQDTFETSVQESLDNYTPKKDDDQLTEEALDDIFGDEPLKEEVVKPIPTSPAGKQISIEDAKETFIPRMHQVYSDCKTKDDINTAYKQIIDGIENFYTKQRYKADTYNYLKQQAWFIRSKYEIPLYRKTYEEQKAKEATESVKSVAA